MVGEARAISEAPNCDDLLTDLDVKALVRRCGVETVLEGVPRAGGRVPVDRDSEALEGVAAVVFAGVAVAVLRNWPLEVGARSFGLCSSPSFTKLFLLSTEGLGRGIEGELAPVGRGIDEAVLGTGKRESRGSPLGRFCEESILSSASAHNWLSMRVEAVQMVVGVGALASCKGSLGAWSSELGVFA